MIHRLGAVSNLRVGHIVGESLGSLENRGWIILGLMLCSMQDRDRMKAWVTPI